MASIKIKNISSGTVILSMPDIHFRRELTPGRVIPISKEVYDDMIYDPGIIGMIEDHYIALLGIPEEEAVIPQENVFDSNAIREMIEKEDITRFSKFIPNAAQSEKEEAVRIATELKTTNNAFVALIKKYCNVDIIEAISTVHKIEG